MVSHSSQRWVSPDSGGGSKTAEVDSDTSAGVICSGSTIGDTRLELLLSFLSPAYKITHGFLRRGASPRKRWTLSGEVEEVGAISAGLAPELAGLLSDSPRLSNALDSLTPAMLKKTDQGYILDVEAVKSIHRDLTTEASAFWKSQALILSYRACPWKYIESNNLDLSLILPHLQYTAESHGDCLESLDSTTGVDFILTILEASRFPTMAWKRSMISLADAAMKHVTSRHGEHIYYLSLRLSSAKSLLHRLEGNHDVAVGEVDKVINREQQAPRNQRDNAAMGHVALQRALNSMQVDDLTKAEQILAQWRHLGDEHPSLMEHVVYFRRGVTLGRILRALGRFGEAHTHLKRSYDLAAQHHNLIFDEDRRDLISELADTLLELDKPYAAEVYLRMEFARRSYMEGPAKSGKSLLEASMAEVLFAQGRTEEAEQICAQAEARWDELMKLGKFRICIVRAKINHTRSDHENAIRYWDMALQQASNFPGRTGPTTLMLVLSRRESRRALGLTDTEGFERYTDPSAAQGKPGGTVYWIAGMRHWKNYLRSEAARTRV